MIDRRFPCFAITAGIIASITLVVVGRLAAPGASCPPLATAERTECGGACGSGPEGSSAAAELLDAFSVRGVAPLAGGDDEAEAAGAAIPGAGRPAGARRRREVPADVTSGSAIDGREERREVRFDGGEAVEIVTSTGRRIVSGDGVLLADLPMVLGRRAGTSRVFDRAGTLRAEEEFVDGEREGEARYFAANGVLVASGRHARGVRSGTWSAWWDDGSPRSTGSWRVESSEDGSLRSRREGEWSFWRRDGSLDRRASGRYRDGDRVDG